MVEHSGRNLDDVFRALVDPTRRDMVRRLSGSEQTVSELAQPFDMSLAAASKHVKVLERAGLIDRSIQGRKHVCRLSPTPLADAYEWLAHYRSFWNERLGSLEQALQEEREGQGG